MHLIVRTIPIRYKQIQSIKFQYVNVIISKCKLSETIFIFLFNLRLSNHL